MKRFLLSAVMVVSLTISAFALVTTPAHASTADWEFYGSDCSSNASAASTINYIRARYDEMSTYTGSGECFGWAEKVSNMLASERSYKEYTNLHFNKKNFLKVCLNAKAGTHLRLGYEKTYNPWYGHSVCLLKVSKNRVCWTDNNAVGYNKIAYYSGTVDEFVSHYGYFDYINMITKTTKYKTQSEPLMAVEKAADGRCRLYWTRTSSTSKYKVYRSTSKDGTYKLIKTTTSKFYTDKTATYGEKYYYYVRSVKSGADAYSNKYAGRARLNPPYLDWYPEHDPKTGCLVVSWDKVPNADKYYIYRKQSGGKEYKLINTTTKTSYKDKKATNLSKSYSYKVKAVYRKNSKASTFCPYATEWESPKLATPKVKHKFNKKTGVLTLTWEKVPYADLYYVCYHEDKKYDHTVQIEDTKKLTYSVKPYYLEPNHTYEFFVEANTEDGSLSDLSEKSNFITVKTKNDWYDHEEWYD